MIKFNFQYIKNLAAPGVWRRGYDYYQKNQVEKVELSEEGILGQVKGNFRDEYNTLLKFSETEVKASCDCPFPDEWCKHAVAVALIGISKGLWNKYWGIEDVQQQEPAEPEIFTGQYKFLLNEKSRPKTISIKIIDRKTNQPVTGVEQILRAAVEAQKQNLLQLNDKEKQELFLLNQIHKYGQFDKGRMHYYIFFNNLNEFMQAMSTMEEVRHADTNKRIIFETNPLKLILNINLSLIGNVLVALHWKRSNPDDIIPYEEIKLFAKRIQWGMYNNIIFPIETKVGELPYFLSKSSFLDIKGSDGGKFLFEQLPKFKASNQGELEIEESELIQKARLERKKPKNTVVIELPSENVLRLSLEFNYDGMKVPYSDTAKDSPYVCVVKNTPPPRQYSIEEFREQEAAKRKADIEAGLIDPTTEEKKVKKVLRIKVLPKDKKGGKKKGKTAPETKKPETPETIQPVSAETTAAIEETSAQILLNTEDFAEYEEETTVAAATSPDTTVKLIEEPEQLPPPQEIEVLEESITPVRSVLEDISPAAPVSLFSDDSDDIPAFLSAKPSKKTAAPKKHKMLDDVDFMDRLFMDFSAPATAKTKSKPEDKKKQKLEPPPVEVIPEKVTEKVTKKQSKKEPVKKMPPSGHIEPEEVTKTIESDSENSPHPEQVSEQSPSPDLNKKPKKTAKKEPVAKEEPAPAKKRGRPPKKAKMADESPEETINTDSGDIQDSEFEFVEIEEIPDSRVEEIPPQLTSKPEAIYWIRRDIEAENAAYKYLVSTGLTPLQTNKIEARDDMVIDFVAKNFPKLCEEWDVEYPDEIEAIRIADEPFRFKVRIDFGEKLDTFFLEVVCSVGKKEINLDDIQELLKEGRKYVYVRGTGYAEIPLAEMLQLTKTLNSFDAFKLNETIFRVLTYKVGLITELLDQNVDIIFSDRFKIFWDQITSFSTMGDVIPPPEIKADLREYQKKGYAWLYFLYTYGLNGILADDMGLGKTVQSLSLLQMAKDDHGSKPSLVICPTSVVFNWEEEIQKFAPGLKTLNFTGSARHSLLNKINSNDVVITSYALIRRDINHLKKYNFRYIILDESQKIKNYQSLTANVTKQLHASHRLALSGTPIENRLSELWSVFDFLMPGFLYDYTEFRYRYAQPIEEYNNRDAERRLKKQVHPFILRRLKQNVAKDLPDKLEFVSYCELLPEQQDIYLDILDQTREELFRKIERDGIARSQMSILSALLRLRQICCHPKLIKELNKENVNVSGKFENLKDMVREVIESGHKILLFSQFVEMLNIIRDWLEVEGIKFEYLTGSTVNRKECVDNFNNNPLIPIFLISLKAGGTGLNLTGADYVIHYDPWWNPAVEDQATDRAHRIGQTKKVFVYRLITKGTVEEKMIKLQEKKRDLIDSVITVDTSLGKLLTYEDIKEIFSASF